MEERLVKQQPKKRIKNHPQPIKHLKVQVVILACLELIKSASRSLVLGTKKLGKVVSLKNIAKRSLLKDIFLQLA